MTVSFQPDLVGIRRAGSRSARNGVTSGLPPYLLPVRALSSL